MGTLHEDQYTFMIIPCWVLLRVRNVSDKSCRENQSTYLMFNFLPPINLAVYEIIWKNMVEPDWPQLTVSGMHFACWILKAIHTHWKYVILMGFPLQQWLHKCAFMLRYLYIACLVNTEWNNEEIYNKQTDNTLYSKQCELTFDVDGQMIIHW